MICGWIFLGACSTVRFYYESDKKVDFSRYKTFAFADDLPQKIFGSSIAAKEFKEEIKNALTVRGLIYNTKRPDVLIKFSSEAETEEIVHTNYFPAWGMWGWGSFGFSGWGWDRGGWWGMPWGWWPGWSWGGPLYSDSRVEKVKKGILTVEFQDAVGNQIIWRSTSKGLVDSPEKIYSMLRNSLKKMLLKLPLRQSPV